ncbi:diguanylate cyclase, partial [Gammaproteobacteria bacterium AH-315-E17]|nr:diguanylate cyclase [Gammaproteobacteria bacterium AH-315-E17]
MLLGNKIIVVIFFVFGAYITLDYFSLIRTITPAFDNLEVEDARRNNTRLINTIDNEIEALVTFTIDWGEWNLTYKYMDDRNEDYIQDNYLPALSLFQDEKLELIFLVDMDGNLAWGRVYDPATESMVDLSYFFSSIDTLLQSFLSRTSLDHNENGIISTNLGPMLIASNAISTNDGESTMRGALLMGRLLNDSMLETLMKQTQLDITYWPLQGSDSAVLGIEGLATLPGEGEIITNVSDENILLTYSYLPYLYGGGLLFRVETPRLISSIGNATVRLMLTSNIIFFTIIMIILFLLLRHIVTKPLTNLREKIAEIEIEPHLDALSFKRLFTDRNDEIGDLETEFDLLLGNLAKKNSKLQIEIDERRKMEAQLLYYASHDPLTGLMNRRGIEERLEQVLSMLQVHADEHVLCFLDLDQFKVVNDSCGHIAGDKLLKKLSVELQAVIRNNDVLVRFGGDEFAVLMEDCSIDQAYAVASSMLKAVQDYQFIWESYSFRVGASIGLVAITHATPIDLIEIFKQADTACYIAKDQGRNRIHIYHSEDIETAHRHGHMQWVNRINKALEKDLFCLYAQPIALLRDNSMNHYEFLIRMKSETGGIFTPDNFLPIAERYRLISKIDYWVVENVFRLLSENPQFMGEVDFCSFNISGQSITKADFLAFILVQLEKFGIEGNKICFEITETSVISNFDSAKEFITTL